MGKLLLTTINYLLCKTKQSKTKYEQTSKEAKGGSKGEHGEGKIILWHHRMKPIPIWHSEEPLAYRLVP